MGTVDNESLFVWVFEDVSHVVEGLVEEWRNGCIYLHFLIEEVHVEIEDIEEFYGYFNSYCIIICMCLRRQLGMAYHCSSYTHSCRSIESTSQSRRVCSNSYNLRRP